MFLQSKDNFRVKLTKEIISDSITIHNLIQDTNCNNIIIQSNFSTSQLMKFKLSLRKINYKTAAIALFVFDYLECYNNLIRVGMFLIKHCNKKLHYRIENIITQNPILSFHAVARNLLHIDNLPNHNINEKLCHDDLTILLQHHNISSAKQIIKKFNITIDSVAKILLSENYCALDLITLDNHNLFTTILFKYPELLCNSFEDLSCNLRGFYFHKKKLSGVKLKRTIDRIFALRNISPDIFSDEEMFDLAFYTKSTYILEKLDLDHIKGKEFNCCDWGIIKINRIPHIKYVSRKGNPELVTRMVFLLCNYYKYKEGHCLIDSYNNNKLLLLTAFKRFLVEFLLILLLFYINIDPTLICLALILNFMTSKYPRIFSMGFLILILVTNKSQHNKDSTSLISCLK